MNVPASAVPEGKLNEAQLREYCENFYGYGNPSGKIWFVGLEEAGGKCEEVVQRRLDLWETDFKKAPVIDGFDFHQRLKDCDGNSLGRMFQDPVPEQKTWDSLIRIQLSFQGKPATSQAIKEIRQNDWTRSTSKSCLLELLPLPSPSTKKWNYDQWTKSDCFKARKNYAEEFRETRVEAIKALIAEYTPRVVLFYGRSRMKRWSEIAGFAWKDVKSKSGVLLKRQGETLFAVIPHPAKRGTKNKELNKIGELLR